MNEEQYYLNKNYRTNKWCFYDDTPKKDEYQDDIYRYIKSFLEYQNNKIVSNLNILDIGCGSGYKLMKYFLNHNTIGTDFKKTISVVKAKYQEANCKWEISDFDKIFPIKFNGILLIDVIEHLKDPNNMLNYIKKQNFDYLFISTPIKKNQNGPPQNKYHIREWNPQEFNKYIIKFFKIYSLHLNYYFEINPYQETQFIICKKY